VYAQSLVVMQILQLPEAAGYGLGQSMLSAGLWVAPSGLMMMAISPLGARLSAARDPKTSLRRADHHRGICHRAGADGLELGQPAAGRSSSGLIASSIETHSEPNVGSQRAHGDEIDSQHRGLY
jgi:hypothetical protein